MTFAVWCSRGASGLEIAFRFGIALVIRDSPFVLGMSIVALSLI